jgi:hypothetical protein
MAYDRDITEGLPYVLSNPSAIRTYALTGAAYDISINGLPFFIFASETRPYIRKTAQYRKDQVDQSREPGEQTLTGWWLRSQSSFHQGKGINFYDPSAGETVQYRFSDSKGVNVWSNGNVSLLNSCIENHITTGAIASNDRPFQFLRSIKFNDVPAVLLHDEYDVDKVYSPLVYSITTKALASNVATLTTSVAHKYVIGTMVNVTGVDATFNGEYEVTAVTSTTFSYAKTYTGTISSTAVTPNGTASSTLSHFVDYNSGSERAVHSICDDGTTAYWVTNRLQGGNQRLTVKKKPLTEGKTTPAGTEMFHSTSIEVTNATMEYVKDRLVMAANNAVYEFSSSAGTMPTALYTHPASTHVYTSITASGTAIYIAGYNGIQSTIHKFTLTTAGAMPTLTSAITAAELPVGERVFKIYYYLGRMLIGTDKGIRIATVSDQDGSILYGPLIVETSQPCYDFAARDHYVWCATSVDGQPGLIRIDLSTEIETLRFAYANDLYYPDGDTLHRTTAVAFLNGTDDLTFATAYASGANGHIYREDSANLLSTGYLTTGKIRYNTLEGKVFKFLTPRIKDENGRVVISSIDDFNNEFTIGDFAEDGIVSDVSIGYPVGAQEHLSFKFTLHRSQTVPSTGAILNGYQIKALPAIPRQRIMQYPLACFDNEKDKFNVQMGYENSSYERLIELETIENTGDTIRIDDFRTGESYTGIIEEIQFTNLTPPDKRFSGVGGILLVTIRSL